MNEIINNQNHMYTLYEDDGKLILAVMCGGIGMYEVKVILTESEHVAFDHDGDSYIHDLAYQIRKCPSDYKERSVM